MRAMDASGGRPWIMIFSHGYPPLGLYGVARHVERLARYLSARGLGVIVVAGGREGLPSLERLNERCLVVRIKRPIAPRKWHDTCRLIRYSLISPLVALGLVRRFNIALVHGNGSYYGGWQAAITAILARRPLTITIHGSGVDYYRHLHRPPLALLFLRWASAVIVQKESAICILERWGIPRKRIFYVEEGAVDTDWFRPAPPTGGHAEPRISFVGRLTRFKDPLLLVEAAPLVLKRFPDAHFVFAGDGYLRPHIERRAEELRIHDKIELLGEVIDTRQVYWSSDVFVALSPYNNFSDLSMLEAMACGLPVIATNSGETYKTIRHGWNGLLVRPRDPEDLAEKILMVLENPGLARRLGENARKTVLERYSIRIFGERMLNVFIRASSGNI
ncbi:MAG: hypothetical protein DRJ69_05425 [Thermoprotei archaeon]|nr:MAG: hypothetical protein DRJ69_05425 [Thermoprotei archaeon]